MEWRDRYAAYYGAGSEYDRQDRGGGSDREAGFGGEGTAGERDRREGDGGDGGDPGRRNLVYSGDG